MNMQEMLSTRDAHEELTTEVAGFLKEQGFDTFTLSTDPAISVKPVLTHRASRADFRKGCIPVWKAMVSW